MKRLIFVNRFFHPDHSATAQILTDLAFHLAGAGREVHVVTSRHRYNNPGVALPERETAGGVVIHRIAGTHLSRAGLLGRGIDHLSFYGSLRRALHAMLQADDIIVAKTDPPLISVVAMATADRAGARLVNWVQDLYPEVAERLGVPYLGGPPARALERWRDRALHAAVANVAVSERMADTIASRGVAVERLHVIPNWCDDDAIVPTSPLDNPLRRQWALEDRFVVGYSGNLGRAHEFDTLLGAANRLKDRGIAFLFIGAGHSLQTLRHVVEVPGLGQRFHFQPYQEREALNLSLAVPDVHWVSLRPELEGLLFPSKLYGIAAAGRPILAIGARNGEIGQLVRRYDCGFVIEPGDVDALVLAIMALRNNPGLGAAMGQRARRMLEERFTRRQALQRWQDLLQSI